MVRAELVVVECFAVVQVGRLVAVDHIALVDTVVVGIVVAVVVGIFVESHHTLNLLRHLLLAG